MYKSLHHHGFTKGLGQPYRLDQVDRVFRGLNNYNEGLYLEQEVTKFEGWDSPLHDL